MAELNPLSSSIFVGPPFFPFGKRVGYQTNRRQGRTPEADIQVSLLHLPFHSRTRPGSLTDRCRQMFPCAHLTNEVGVPSKDDVVYSCMLCNLCMVLLRMCALVLVSVSDSHVGMTIIDLSESITSEPR